MRTLRKSDAPGFMWYDFIDDFGDRIVGSWLIFNDGKTWIRLYDKYSTGTLKEIYLNCKLEPNQDDWEDSVKRAEKLQLLK